MQLDFRPFDADNHYYEPLDAFTRYQTLRLKVTTGSSGNSVGIFL